MENENEEQSEEDETMLCNILEVTSETEYDETSAVQKFENQFNLLDRATKNTETLRIVSLPIVNESSVNYSKTIWSQRMTKTLIKEYKAMVALFQNSKKKQKDLWSIIANKLRRKGYDVDWNMCDRKFRNLKTTFRAIHYSNRSEASKRRWEFYEDMLLLVPPYPKHYTMFKKLPDSNEETQNYIIPDIESSSQDINLNTSPVLKISENKVKVKENKLIVSPKMTNNTNSFTEPNKPPDWFNIFFKQYKSDQMQVLEKIKKMHDESKNLELQKINLLKEVLTLLKNK